ncbi:hypothetical protein HDU98_004597 [Podochytrium sp. JEL0797]|nr:hypothetical protein HDU98_004597 [Podochytrium sp. JEL0797]
MHSWNLLFLALAVLIGNATCEERDENSPTFWNAPFNAPLGHFCTDPKVATGSDFVCEKGYDCKFPSANATEKVCVHHCVKNGELCGTNTLDPNAGHGFICEPNFTCKSLIAGDPGICTPNPVGVGRTCNNTPGGIALPFVCQAGLDCTPISPSASQSVCRTVNNAGGSCGSAMHEAVCGGLLVCGAQGVCEVPAGRR